MYEQDLCRGQQEWCMCTGFSQVLGELWSMTPILLEINELIYILILWNKPLSKGQFAGVTADVQKLSFSS